MLAALWSGLGGVVASQWSARLLSPAFAFWATGVLIVTWHEHDRGWRSVADFWAGRPGWFAAAAVLAALVVVAGSSVLAASLARPVLRLLEGYGPWPDRVRGALINHRVRRRARIFDEVARLRRTVEHGRLSDAEFAELRALERAGPPDPARLNDLRGRAARADPRDVARLARLEARLARRPAQPAQTMPTALGDLLRAAENQPYEKYGLGAIDCWVPLWLTLPDHVRDQVAQAQAGLDRACQGWLWSALLVVWTPWAWWAPLAALGCAFVVHRIAVVPAAEGVSRMIAAVFDLYRFGLYDALHLPRPARPDAEPVAGAQVTRALRFGIQSSTTPYTAGP